MEKQSAYATHSELRRLLALTECVGNDPLLTQASTGNSSVKLGELLWIKASGKWMRHANRDEILIPLDLPAVRECLQRRVDPAARYPGASLETAVHAALPQRVVLHVHCVDTIAWAVRRDGPRRVQELLQGIAWHWIPYTPSGLPLAEAVQRALAMRPGADVFVLANHGLFICGKDTQAVGTLLADVRRRLALPPRRADPADYAALRDLSRASNWGLPDDNDLHALGTDAVCRRILSGGLLYPCQAIFTGTGSPRLFEAVRYRDLNAEWHWLYGDRPFLIVEGRGVLVNSAAEPAVLAMISGLAQVLKRLSEDAPLRYLTAKEIAAIPSEAAFRYRELAAAGHGSRQG